MNNGYIEVMVKAYGNEEVTNKKVLVPDFGDIPLANVKVAGGVTKNLGNYESARIDVEVSLPCLPCKEEVMRVSDMAYEWVNEVLGETVEVVLVNGK